MIKTKSVVSRRKKMEFNTCSTCKASDGRCGMLINGECINCFYTKKGHVHIDFTLKRTDAELKRTMKKA